MTDHQILQELTDLYNGIRYYHGVPLGDLRELHHLTTRTAYTILCCKVGRKCCQFHGFTLFSRFNYQRFKHISKMTSFCESFPKIPNMIWDCLEDMIVETDGYFDLQSPNV